MECRVYLVNLARYVSGKYTGAWFTFPLDPEDVAQKLGLSVTESEIMVCDTDNFPLDVYEYSSIEELNRMYRQIGELPDYIVGSLREFVSNMGDLESVLSACEDGKIVYYSGVESVEDLAYYLIDECGVLGEIPEWLTHYIDYVAFARDFEIEHIIVDVSGGMCVIYD